MIEGQYLAMADALAHDQLLPYLQTIYIGCERCGNPHLLPISYNIQKPRVEGLDDIVLETRYFFKCPACGFEEADILLTIIPSWQWHPFREKMPKTGKEVFKEKINLVRLWNGKEKVPQEED